MELHIFWHLKLKSLYKMYVYSSVYNNDIRCNIKIIHLMQVFFYASATFSVLCKYAVPEIKYWKIFQLCIWRNMRIRLQLYWWLKISYRTNMFVYIRKCQKIQRGGHKKKKWLSSMSLLAVRYGSIGCYYRWEASGWWSTMNKRVVFFLFIFVMHLPSTCHWSTPFDANYYYFSPNHKTKANSRRLVVRTHVRDFFYHNEERYCACFKHPPLTRLSPRCKDLPPDYNI
jgi:hypothetical protein